MINKRLFEVDKSERDRILSLHESATKKQYLSEESDDADILGLFRKKFTEDEINKGAEILAELKNSPNMRPVYWTLIANAISKSTVNNPYETWAGMESNTFPKKVIKAFKAFYDQSVLRAGDVEDWVEGTIGRYFIQNPAKMSMVQDIVSKTPQDMDAMVKSFAAKPPSTTP